MAGYGLLVGLLGLMPLLFFWSFTAMDFNLRKNGGRGSNYVWTHLLAPPRCRSCGCRDEAYWNRHLGTDALCTMWFMSLIAGVTESGIALLLATGIWRDAHMWFLFADGFFLSAAMLLMTAATYPHNFNVGGINRFKDVARWCRGRPPVPPVSPIRKDSSGSRTTWRLSGTERSSDELSERLPPIARRQRSSSKERKEKGKRTAARSLFIRDPERPRATTIV